MAIEHKDITDAERHPPKGASTAVSGTHMVSDGAGDVSWKRHTEMGWVNYEDTATTTTPILLTPTGAFVKLTNDSLGIRTNTAFKLPSMSDLWDSTVNQFDFSSLKVGDVITIRTDLNITTTGPSHNVKVIYRLGIGGFSFDLVLTDSTFKSAGTHQQLRTINVFMGDSNIVDNPGELLALSDTGTTDTVTINGWFIEVISRGED